MELYGQRPEQSSVYAMSRAISIAFLLFALLWMAPSAHATVGCGATSAGMAQYDQSTCGNVAPFPPAARGTPVSSCRSLTTGTYHLTKNIGGSPEAVCMTFTAGPVTLDFAGFQITGRIVATDITASRSHVYSSAAGGTLTCADHSRTAPGCLFISAYDAVRGALEIDHLTLRNTDGSSINSARNLYIDWGATTSFVGTAPAVKIHHITSTSATGLESARIPNIHVNFRYDADFHDNLITCLSTAAACQGIVAFGPNAQIHNNKMVCQQLNTSNLETARAIACDSAKGCHVYNNYFDVHDNRAVRLRDVENLPGAVDIHDNLIDNVTRGVTANYIGAIHVCDPDVGSNEGSNYVIQNNTINNQDGVVLMSRGCAGYPKFRNNRIGCIAPCSGMLASIRSPLAGSTTTFELRDNAPVAFTAVPQSSIASRASVWVCNTGTIGGEGRITSLCDKVSRLFH